MAIPGRLEVYNVSRMNWRVFIAVLGVKLLLKNQLFGIFACGVVVSYFIVTDVAQFFFFVCFMRKKALIMQRMQIFASYADLHHCILQDALSWHH